MNPDLEQRRGNDAAFIINSDIWQHAWTKLHAGLANARRNAPLTATETHTRLILMEQLAHILRKNMEDTMTTGKMATLQIESEQRARKWWQRN